MGRSFSSSLFFLRKSPFFIFATLLCFAMMAAGVEAKAAPGWTAACHNVVLVYQSQDQNGVHTSTLESEVKTQVGGITCVALDKWKLPLMPPMIDLAATQAANPGIEIIQTTEGVKVKTPQAPGTFLIVKVVGQAQVEIGDSYASWPTAKKGQAAMPTHGLVAKDTVNFVNFGEERLVTPENINLELILNLLNNRFAVSPHSALDATVYSLGPDELVNMQLSLAPDFGAYLPPIPLTNFDESSQIVDLLSSVEMDSQDNIHVLFNRLNESQQGDFALHLFMISTDAAGTPLHPPAELPISNPSNVHFSNAMAIDGNDHLHVVFNEFSETDEGLRGLNYVRSEDGGATWSSPVAIVAPDQSASLPSVAVSPDGSRVVVSYYGFKFEEFEDDVTEAEEYPAGAITVAVSDDGGVSFPTHTLISWNSRPNNPGGFSTVPWSKVALDPEDRIFVVYLLDNLPFLNGPRGIYTLLKTSSDGGNSYGTPTLIHQEFGESVVGNLSPININLAIDRLGRVDVLFPSDPDEDATTWSYELTRSVDGGLSFSPAIPIVSEDDEIIVSRGIRHDKEGQVLAGYMSVFDVEETAEPEPVFDRRGVRARTCLSCEDRCGDGTCSAASGENNVECPADCGSCGDNFCSKVMGEVDSCAADCACGNHICSPEIGEDAFFCPEDCGVCEDGLCSAELGEDLASCVFDCAFCGDGICSPEADEDIDSCALDCGSCGDGLCSPELNENITSCFFDCPCENGLCEIPRGENILSCPGDCPISFCGDFVCVGELGENAGSCPTDCFAFCGDGFCTVGENVLSCNTDCGGCGDGICNAAPPQNESPDTCSQDCGSCGDGICSRNIFPEYSDTCPQDCSCGNGTCEPTDSHFEPLENPGNCAGDCPNSCSNEFFCDPSAGDNVSNCYRCGTNCTDHICSPEGGENTVTCLVDCGTAVCGDQFCEVPQGENTITCQDDCFCGNGVCDPGPPGFAEDGFNCFEDCGICGDGICEVSKGENNNTCQFECPVACGNGGCEFGENQSTCPQDCTGQCGNGTCEVDEITSSCHADCFCGNGSCDPQIGENLATCGDDCGVGDCANGFCDPGEDISTCPGDCFCGNFACDSGEDVNTCQHDCGCIFCSFPCSATTECQALAEQHLGFPPESSGIVCQDSHCDGPATCEPPGFPSLGAISCAEQPDPNGYCVTTLGFAGFTQCNIADGCCENTCGNGTCDPGEDPFTCPPDCPTVCPNGICEPGEDQSNCPDDCGGTSCGNGVCDPGEDANTCQADCCSLCGFSCSGAPECQAIFEGSGFPQEFLDALVCQDSHCDGPAVCPPDAVGTISCAGQADPNGYCSTTLGFAGFTQCNIAGGCCQMP